MAANGDAEENYHKSHLSLTGRLLLQEKKGKFSFKKKTSYWFWFDDKECALKYYKNMQSYQTNFHNFEGKISLKGAKVTPSEVCATDEGSQKMKDNFSNKTFLIFASTGSMFALTAETDTDCHQWIKKLQEKRASWDKRVRTPTQTIQGEFLATQDGLMHEQVESRTKQHKSHVHKIFEEYLGPDHLPANRRPLSFPQFLMESEHYEATDGPITETSQEANSFESISTGESDTVPQLTLALTPEQKKILELQVQLSKSREERERLNHRIVTLEDQVEKERQEKLPLKNEIQELKETVHKLKTGTSAQDLFRENESLSDVISQLKRSLQSINGEAELYKEQLKDRDKKIAEEVQKQKELNNKLLSIKLLYVSLLSSSYQIQTPTPSGMSSGDESDPMEEKLKNELLDLIKDELSSESNLVDISGDLSLLEDQYGEFHDWNNDTNIFHFLCYQLQLHYTKHNQVSITQEWCEYVKHLKVTKDSYWEIPPLSSVGKRKEMVKFLRKGIPDSMRAKMWKSLVNFHIGKTRDSRNSLTTGGINYYQSLLRTKSQVLKAIQTDLHRTIPNNKFFKENAAGCVKLERVLIAYSNHNRNIGYCQGMNMIAAIGLLYLDEESTFWFLVAIVEKILPEYYFSHGLSAVRADQSVMQDLIAEKLDILKDHLDENGIDLTIVTFKWFLTIFVDGLPTESVLRVMDCFLLEGRKIVFRLALAIFKLHEDRILNMTDSVTIFMLVKEISNHIFNMDELFKVAFSEFRPFPSRGNIKSRCKPYLKEYFEEWKEREKMPAVSLIPSPIITPIHKPKKNSHWECGAIINSREVWLCSGDRQSGRICAVKTVESELEIKSPSIFVASKILCIKAFPNNIVMIGTLDFSIHAISTITMKEVWSMKLNDSVLDFVWYRDSLVCALADGYIATLRTMGDMPLNHPILYRIGNTAIQCMVFTEHCHIWIGCGPVITVLETGQYEPVQAIVTPSEAGKVYKMEQSRHGIWVTFKNSSLICLYDSMHMVQLLTINHASLLPEAPGGNAKFGDCRVTAVSAVNDMVWIGTGNGSIHLFRLISTCPKPSERVQQIARLLKKDDTSGGMDHSLRVSLDDEGLVNKRKESFTAPTRRYIKTANARQDQFGEVLRKRNRQEIHQDRFNKENVYKMEHLWSSKIYPDVQECLKITVLKPIKQNGQQLLISCINSCSLGDRAVQLWERAACYDLLTTDEQWIHSYTTLTDCYSVVNKEHTDEIIGKPRSFSTIIGSLSPTDSIFPLSNVPAVLKEELSDDEHEIS